MTRTAPVSRRAPTPRYAALPALLLLLTALTGIVDAVSYLHLGHVFVANMTGNVVFVGFAASGSRDVSLPAALTALAAFLLGAAGSGRVAAHLGHHQGRLLLVITSLQLTLLVAATGITATTTTTPEGTVRYLTVVLLGATMGLQNAAARRLAIPDATTTVLTLTLTGLAADSHLAGGAGAGQRRKLNAVATMGAGALAGAAITQQAGTAPALAVACALVTATLVALAVLVRGTVSSDWAKPSSNVPSTR